MDFLCYIIRPNYLESYEELKGTMKLVEIKEFLSLQASFASQANSYNLMKKVGSINDEKYINSNFFATN